MIKVNSVNMEMKEKNFVIAAAKLVLENQILFYLRCNNLLHQSFFTNRCGWSINNRKFLFRIVLLNISSRHDSINHCR